MPSSPMEATTTEVPKELHCLCGRYRGVYHPKARYATDPCPRCKRISVVRDGVVEYVDRESGLTRGSG